MVIPVIVANNSGADLMHPPEAGMENSQHRRAANCGQQQNSPLWRQCRRPSFPTSATLQLTLLLLALALSPASAVFECNPQETATFVRISRARLDGTPLVVSTAGHDLTCSQYCRNNIEPTTGAQRLCASFNFDGRETCYFFDDAAA